jgi:hypothetical protein
VGFSFENIVEKSTSHMRDQIKIRPVRVLSDADPPGPRLRSRHRPRPSNTPIDHLFPIVAFSSARHSNLPASTAHGLHGRTRALLALSSIFSLPFIQHLILILL